MQPVRLFLSAVSEEFRTYRDALRTKLQRPNVTVHVQEDFIATGTETLDKLDLYIRDCDAVIHLLGDRTGAWAAVATLQTLKSRYPDLATRLPALKSSIEIGQPAVSYTQWEAYLAIYHRKTLLIASAAPEAVRDRNFAADANVQASQHEHRERLQQLGRYAEISFRNKDELITEVSLSAVLDLLAKAHAGPQQVSNVPIRVPQHFLGRDDSMATIEEALGRHQDRVSVVVLHGLRGVGKTTLAAAYVERHRTDYRATWWIRAQTPDSMRADLVGLGVRLGWVAADEKEEPAFASVKERLRYEGENILLIYDNAISADDLKPYLPPGGAARVLITSNAHAFRAIAAPVQIRLWPASVGADYLVARTGRTAERAAAEALSDALGGLPLAHEQAAAYCERLEISIADYRKRFQTAPVRLLDSEHDAPAEYHDRQTVAKTFSLAIDEAARLNPCAQSLVALAAELPPEPIPLFLFAESREKFGEPLASALADDGLDEAVAALRTFGLIDREAIVDERDPTITTDTIRLHRLVRQVALAQRDGKWREDARRTLVEAVAAIYPEGVFNDPNTWPRARRLDPLASALVEGAPVAGAELLTADLLDALGTYKHGALAAYAQARPLKERALSIREQTLGPEHRDVAKSLNALALLLWDQRDLEAARPLQERALAIREKVLGAEHADTAMSLNNLALLLEDQGDLAAALPLYRRATAILEKVRGPEHSDTALSLNNLANLLHAQGDLTGAMRLYERALAIFQKTLDAGHPLTGRARRNLARLLLAQFDAPRALTLAEAALAAHEKSLGPRHPWTKDSAQVAACALETLGRGDKAKALRAQYDLEA